MKRSAFYFLPMFLTGCATYSISYNPEQIPEANLATINFEKLEFLDRGTKFEGFISAAFDSDGKRVIEKQADEVKVPIGKYIFVAYCTNGSVYSYPKMGLEVSEGKTYTLTCKNHTEKGFLGLDTNKSVSLEILSESN